MLQPQHLTGLEEIASSFDGFFFDLWGVTHNGKVPFPGALDCLNALKDLGKTVVFLSNAPRRPSIAKDRLTEMGVDSSLYADLYTSGYDCYLHLKDRPDSFYQELGNRFFHTGPERDHTTFQGLDIIKVDSIAEADFILATGTDSWASQLSDYEPLLQEARAKNIPLICANPDRIVMLGDDVVLCPGSISERYEQLGGFVRYHGKPDPKVYQCAFDLLNIYADKPVAKERILMIGDSLATDITGANRFGIPSLMVMSGIHGFFLLPHKDDLDALQFNLGQLTEKYKTTPTYIMEELSWF